VRAQGVLHGLVLFAIKFENLRFPFVVMSTSVEDATFLAAKQGREEDIRELLNVASANWAAKDPLGNTPLHYAAGPHFVTLIYSSTKTGKIKVNIIFK